MAEARREEWAKRVERWKDSGLTAREFAREAGLNAGTLSFWKWRLKKEHASGQPVASTAKQTQRRAVKKPRFVEITAPIATFPGATRPLELIVADRYAVRLANDFDEGALQRLLRSLEHRT